MICLLRPESHMNKNCIVLDVGGTTIKGSFVRNTMAGSAPEMKNLSEFPAKSDGTAEEIFENFAGIFRSLSGSEPVSAVCMAFPGPFDYERGICRMHGVAKYDSIYGMSIQDNILQLLQRQSPETINPDAEFLYVNDVEAFALGQTYYGDLESFHRILFVCLGTGAGSAFVENGKIRKDGSHVPANGWIYPAPYKQSTIDDYLSARGLRKLSQDILHKSYDGLYLYRLCCNKDQDALRVYHLFGIDVRDALRPFLDDFQPECLVLGGNITRSFRFFGNFVSDYCREKDIKVRTSPETSRYALMGLLYLLEDRHD